MTTRLYIRNLPKALTTEDLKSHFSSLGVALTDCVVVTDPKTRVSRRIGFVGTRTVEDAAALKKHFNNTFLKTSRISVEDAVPQNQPVQSAASKYSAAGRNGKNGKSNDKQSEKNDKKKGKEQEKQSEMGQTKDGKKRDLEALLKKGKVWANDDMDVLPPQAKKARTSKGDDDDSENSDDEYQDMPIQQAGKASTNDSDSDSELAESDSEDEEMNDVSGSKNKNKNKKVDGKQKGASAAKKEASDDDEEDKSSEDSEDAVDQKRLFVRNLPYGTTEVDLQSLFGAHGTVKDVHLPRDSATHQITGFGYIQFEDEAVAEAAMTVLDSTPFMGRVLHITHALPLPKPHIATGRDADTSGAPAKKLTFKEQRALERKNQANAKAVNSAYMNPSAVTTSIARATKREKAEIVNPHGESVAVRMALAETALLHGQDGSIHGTISDDAVNTSPDAIRIEAVLLRNLSPELPDSELQGIVSRYGSVVEMRYARGRTMCIVEYGDRNEAKAAYRGLAYKKIRGMPLYVDLGQNTASSSGSAATASGNDKAGVLRDKEVDSRERTDGDNQQGGQADGGRSRTLFVKNLSFSTTEPQIREVFPNAANIVLKRGYCFVEFPSHESASSATQHDGDVVDGHRWSVTLSKPKGGAAASSGSSSVADAKTSAALGEKGRTKMMVRNVAFEATEKDLRELFGAVGHLKAVRVPRKHDGNRRGFAFIEYLTPGEAQRAMQTLKDTHLYGRHMVLEWANQDDLQLHG